MNKFSKASKNAAPKAKPKASRWSKVKASEDRTPIIAAGEYTCRHKSARIKNESGEWGVVTFEVIEAKGADATPVGDEAVMLQGMGDKFNIGLGKLKKYVMALIGCEDEDTYDEFDPEGEFLDAVFGEFPEDEDRAKELAEQVAEMVTDREVHFKVRRGNPTKDGDDYYREFTWTTNEASED